MEYTAPPYAFPAQYAVLGLLADHPGHGYELRERVKAGLGEVWHIALSQLYSVLRRLESEGLVEGVREEPEGRPARTVYQTTETGERAFLSWATAPVEHVRDLRVELFAKVYLLRRVAPQRVEQLVSGQIRMLESMQRGLEKRKCLATDDAHLSALTLDYRRAQVAGTLEWLRRRKDELICQEDVT